MNDNELEKIFASMADEPGDRMIGREAFNKVSSQLGIGAGRRRRHMVLIWSQRIAAALSIPLAVTLALTITHSVQNKRASLACENEWVEKIVPYGQTYDVTLADGTSISLNAGSRITYPKEFRGDKREIFLDGEAFAKVTKNPDMPFVIHSGEMDLRVLGTTFNFKAYRDDAFAEVSLLEGAVNLEVRENGKNRQVMMSPGDFVQYDRKEETFDLSHFDAGDYNRREPHSAISFQNLPMSDIALDLGRIFNVKIQIRDEKLAKTRFFGYFSNGESLDQILSAMKVGRSMRVEKKGDVIYLSSRN